MALTAALEDDDWATRLTALEKIEKTRAALPIYAINIIREMVIRGIYDDEAKQAVRTLKALNIPLPGKIVNRANFTFYASSWAKWAERVPDAKLRNDGYKIQGTSSWKSFSGNPKDYYVSLYCAWDSGELNAGYGLLIGETNSSFYYFMISKSGWASAGQYLPGRDTGYITLLKWNQNASESIISHNTSFIGVLKSNDTLYMTVNGRSIGSFQDIKKFPFKAMGVIVGANASAIFRDAIVAKVK